MDSSDIEKFYKLMTGVAENFSARLSEAGTDLMFEALKQYPFDQIYKASIQILRTRKYTTMPTIADYVEAIEGNKDDQAEHQCSQVVRAIRECGRYTIPNFKDPLTDSIVKKHYGWENICSKTEKELPFFEKEFKAKYISNRNIKSVKAIQAPEELAGLIENLTKGIE